MSYLQNLINKYKGGNKQTGEPIPSPYTAPAIKSVGIQSTVDKYKTKTSANSPLATVLNKYKIPSPTVVLPVQTTTNPRSVVLPPNPDHQRKMALYKAEADAAAVKAKKAGSFRGLFNATVEALPKATKDAAAGIAQGIARSVGTVGITAGNVPFQIANKITGSNGPLPFSDEIQTSGNKITNAIFGGKPVRTLGGAVEKTQNDIEPYVGKTGSRITSLPLVVGSIVLDLTGFGGKAAVRALGEIPEAFFKFVTKETNPEVLKSTLKSIGLAEEDAKVLAQQLAETKTIDESKDVIANYAKEGATPQQRLLPGEVKPTSPEGTTGAPRTDIVNKAPDLNLKRNVTVTDIHGNKATITEGEALSAYELKGGKVLLKDGKEYIVSKNQYENIKGNATTGEAKPFAPELAGTQETVKGYSKSVDAQGNTIDKVDTKYQSYQLPGGTNYKEVLIKAPETPMEVPKTQYEIRAKGSGVGVYDKTHNQFVTSVLNEDAAKAQMDNLIEIENKRSTKNPGNFNSSHWNEPNVISHLRLNERTYNGQKVAFMEELQSDWAREARKQGFAPEKAPTREEYFTPGNIIKSYGGGYDKVIAYHPAVEGASYPNNYWSVDVIGVKADGSPKAGETIRHHATEPDLSVKGVPNNPLLKNWQELSIKRALKDAVDSGSEYFSWINGEQTSARYNLATHLDDVKWEITKSTQGTPIRTIDLKLKGGNEKYLVVDEKGIVQHGNLGSQANGKKLDEVLGKGLADKIMEKESGSLSGEGLKFGGEWASNLYDKQVGNIVSDLTGAKVETLDLGLLVDKPKAIFDVFTTGAMAERVPLKPDMVKVGKIIIDKKGDYWVITDTLADGKFKAVTKNEFDHIGSSQLEEAKQTFDISSKKSAGQQAIKLTPEIKAKIRGEAPPLKQPSKALPTYKKTNLPAPAKSIDEAKQALSEAEKKAGPLGLSKSEQVNAAAERAKAGEDFGMRPERATLPKPRAVKSIPRLSAKEASAIPEELQNKLIQHEMEREALDSSLLKGLKKYVQKKGEFAGQLPEVTGKNVASKFKRSGDTIIDEALGSKDTYAQANDAEVVRADMEKYLAKEKALKENELELAQEVKAFKDANKSKILSQRDEATLNKFLNKTGDESDRIARKIERIQKYETRLKAEEEVRQQKIRNINAAFETVSKKPDIKGILPKLSAGRQRIIRAIRRATKPFKDFDDDIKKIYLDRKVDLLVGKENAQKEFENLDEALKGLSRDDRWKLINDYENNARNPEIDKVKNVFDRLHALAQKETKKQIPYRGNYIPHVYRETPEEIHKAINEYLVKEKKMTKEEAEAYQNGRPLDENQIARLKLSRFFERTRTIDTYEIAAKYNLHPLYTDPAQLAAYYRNELEETIANNKFADSLSEKGKILVDQVAPRDWQYINVPGFEGMKAPQKLQKSIEGLFTPGSDFWKWTATFNRRATDFALSGGIPYTTENYFALSQAIKETTAGNVKALKALARSNSDTVSMKWFETQKPTIYRMAKQGLDVSQRIGGWEKAYTNAVSNGSFGKIAGREFDRAFNNKTFESFVPQMHIQMFDDVYTKAIKEGLDSPEAEKLAGDIIKKSFGLIEDWGRSKSTRDIISTFLFAPRYREAIANTLWNTAKSVTTEITNLAFRRNRKLLIGMAISYALYNALNYKLNGHFTWQNPKGREFAVKIPINGGKDSIYIEWMPGFLALPRNLAQAGIALGKGNLSTFGQKVGTAFSIPVKTASEVISNSDYFGRPIWSESDSTGVKLAKIAAHMGVSVSHPWIREAQKYLFPPSGVRPPLWQSISTAIELPLKFGSTNKEQTNQYYDESHALTVQHAKENRKYKETWQKIHDLVNAKQTAEANKIYNALTDDEKAIIKRINTSEKTKATKSREVELYGTLLDIRKLNREGKKAEAENIYNALSEKDKKLLQSLNKSHPSKNK